MSSISSQYSVSNGVGTGYNGAPFLNYFHRTHVKLTGQIEDNTLVIGVVTQEDVYDHFGDFFEVTKNPVHPWGGGSSGSPILDDNKVYGILHAGGANDNPDICVFFSAAYALRKILQQNNNNIENGQHQNNKRRIRHQT